MNMKLLRHAQALLLICFALSSFAFSSPSTTEDAPKDSKAPSDKLPKDSKAPTDKDPSDIAPDPALWDLVWQDEFARKGSPDRKKWTYEVGFVRNQELQYYTEKRSQNARVENGSLILEARKERFKNPKFTSDKDPSWQKNRKYADYTSACLITQGLASWQYGRIDIRAKLPRGKGVWPAFWLMGSERSLGWPACGEIDLMEYVHASPTTIYGTLHWPGKNPDKPSENHGKQGGNTTCPDVENWHLYSLEWDENAITFFFDGKPYYTADLSKADGSSPKCRDPKGNPFRQSFYLLINFAVGGSWGGEVDPAIFPRRMEVDYVRIYEKKKSH